MGKGENTGNQHFYLFPQCFLTFLKQFQSFSHISLTVCRVLRGSVVKCLTRNPEVLGSSRTGTSEFFMGVSLGQTLLSASLVLVKPRKDMNNPSCLCDKTKNTIESIVKHSSINLAVCNCLLLCQV